MWSFIRFSIHFICHYSFVRQKSISSSKLCQGSRKNERKGTVRVVITIRDRGKIWLFTNQLSFVICKITNNMLLLTMMEDAYMYTYILLTF